MTQRPKPRPKPRRLACRVEFYSGYRAEETPRLIHCGGRDLTVEKVLGRRRIRDAGLGRVSEEFTLRLSTGTALLRRGPSGRWWLVSHPS